MLAREQPTALRFIDLPTLHRRFDVPLPAAGYATATAWLTRRRLLALVSIDDARHRLYVVDPTARKIVSALTIDGQLEQVASSRGKLLLLLAPPDRVGVARLLTIGANGRVETVSLPRTLAGSRKTPGSPLLHGRLPGLAVDVSGGHAYILVAGAPVADVDLTSMHVSYQQTHVNRSLAGRLAAWLVPQAEAKGIVGPQRQALWLGHGLLALTGVDDQTSIDRQGGWHYRFDPAGLTLINTHSWTARTIDSHTTTAWRLGQTLLALDSSSGGGPATLVGYDLSGKRLYTASVDTDGLVYPAGADAYVETINGSKLVLLDGHTGAVLAHTHVAGLTLLVDDAIGGRT